jgi:hypothetical protein
MTDHKWTTTVRRVVSGGQTGADRGALDAAMALELDHGGWCPRGRRAEDGRIPARYHLQETESRDYPVRTERNIVHSDATLIIGRGPLAGGSALTARLARARGKPYVYVDLDQERGIDQAAGTVRRWLEQHPAVVLNVAGPRASHCPGIAGDVRALLIRALAQQPPANNQTRLG